MHEETVILVDETGREIGTEEKFIAHRLGKLHRAFSVFVYYQDTSETLLLLQKRHPQKYHSGGLWTNTCCSHPRPHEDVIAAGERRLVEEMGIHAALTYAGEFQYTANVGNDLIENEYDYVLVGRATSAEVHFDTSEVSTIRWIPIAQLKKELAESPTKFSPWFQQAFSIAQTMILCRGGHESS